MAYFALNPRQDDMTKRLEPCSFGLRKRLGPVVVIFFKNVKKITSVGSSAFQKNLQQLDQPTLVISLEMKKF